MLTGLQPAVNADKSLTWQTALTDAGHAGVLVGIGMKSLTLASKATMPAEELGGMVRAQLSAMLGNQPQLPGMAPWKYDATLDGLLGPALETVFANVAGSQDQPWFGWGPVTAASAVYNYNLLFAYTAASQQPGSFSVFILGLTVTVNLSEQQLLSLAPGTSATYTVTGNVIPGTITEKTQMLS